MMQPEQSNPVCRYLSLYTGFFSIYSNNFSHLKPTKMKKPIAIAVVFWLFIILNIAWVEGNFNASRWGVASQILLALSVTLLITITGGIIINNEENN